MAFKFCKYDREELAACGRQFFQDFNGLEQPSTGLWSDAVFDWFRDSRADGLCTCPIGGRGGEFLVDHCHGSFPDGLRDGSDSDFWKDLLLRPCRIDLALESEWGKWKNPESSLNMILYDASKLAAIRATAKVMVYSSQEGSNRDQIVNELRTLRMQWNDTSPWLWIDVPWEHARPRSIAFDVFS